MSRIVHPLAVALCLGALLVTLTSCLHLGGFSEPAVAFDAAPEGIKSPRSSTPAGLLVRNESSRDLVVDWVDFAGERLPQTTVPAKTTQSVGSRVGHAFIIEVAKGPDAGRFVRVAFADFPTGDVVIRDADFDKPDKYRLVSIEGWPIQLDKAMSSKETNAVTTLLQEKLAEVKRLVPPRHLPMLQSIVIWIDNDAGASRGQYHPNFYWMKGSGWHLHKRMAIHFGRPESLLKSAKTQPMVVLHELSHAYHHQVLGFDHKLIEKAFLQAEEAGLYDRVKHVNGRTVRAYAMTNEREYFAELTEAYFGTNDFFPFTRDELRRHDPIGYRMIEKVWGVN